MDAAAHQHCVLIVEDHQDTREGLQLLLTMEGCDQVRVAANGAEALALLGTEFRPCIILLDMFMLAMGGMHFLAAKVADPALAAIPLIAISDGVGTDAIPAGVAVFVLKPIDCEQLLALIATHCANAPDSDRR
jgi:CheY-like chemotaxis protein